jgi:hypothetical protein
MTKESNIEQHSENKFSKLVEQGLKQGGIHVCGSKNHGKSRLLFSMAKELQNGKARVLIFDGSETWLYAYSRIPVFTVQDRDIALIEDVKSTEQIEYYRIKNWNLVEFALDNYSDILFRLKTRKPSKRGFFVRTVINHLDQQQREQRERTIDNEAEGYVAYFIEEAQDCFNSRSTTRLEAEEFLTVFNEARNQREAFFTASQRLTDFSKTIRTKQLYCIGRINEEDHGGLRNLEKNHKMDFSKIPARQWFFEGETFASPEWKQDGKPFQINKETKRAYVANLPKPRESKVKSAFKFLFGLGRLVMHVPQIGVGVPTEEERAEEDEEDEREDSEGDGLFVGGGDVLFPPET